MARRLLASGAAAQPSETTAMSADRKASRSAAWSNGSFRAGDDSGRCPAGRTAAARDPSRSRCPPQQQAYDGPADDWPDQPAPPHGSSTQPGRQGSLRCAAESQELRVNHQCLDRRHKANAARTPTRIAKRPHVDAAAGRAADHFAGWTVNRARHNGSTISGPAASSRGAGNRGQKFSVLTDGETCLAGRRPRPSLCPAIQRKA